jgi:hypothetical protein
MRTVRVSPRWSRRRAYRRNNTRLDWPPSCARSDATHVLRERDRSRGRSVGRWFCAGLRPGDRAGDAIAQWPLPHGWRRASTVLCRCRAVAVALGVGDPPTKAETMAKARRYLASRFALSAGVSSKAASNHGTRPVHNGRASCSSPACSNAITRTKRAVARCALAAMAPTPPCATVANICRSSPVRYGMS